MCQYGPSNRALYSPERCRYDCWRNELKKTLDPNDAPDAGFYTDPDFAHKTPPEHVRRVIEQVW